MSDQNGDANKNHHDNEPVSTDPLLGQGATCQGTEFGKAGDGRGGISTSVTSSTVKRKTVRLAEDANQNKQESLGLSSGGLVAGDDNKTFTRRRVYNYTSSPDGGWGWVVVFSSFAISMLVDGVCFSFGIFFDEFREEFGSSKSETSWVGSVLNGTYLLIGPIVSVLVNFYGCKVVAMSGAVLSSLAFLVSTYSTSLKWLILTFGFLGGFGFGLMYLPAIVMVGYYFERRRALATGIACCGSGMGAFIFAPLTEYLIYEYGWRGATWIISGLVLNGVVFALFYRPLEEFPHDSTCADTDDSVTSIVSTSELVEDRGRAFVEQQEQLDKNEEDEKETPTPGFFGMFNNTGSPSTITRDLRHHILDMLKQGPKLTASHRTRSVMLSEVNHTKDVSRLARSTDFGQPMPRRRRDSARSAQHVESGGGSEHHVTYLKPLQRKDIFYSGSLMHLSAQRSLGLTHADTGRIEEHDQTANHSVYDDFSLTTSLNAKQPRSFSEALSAVFDLSLLLSPTFLIYGMSCFLCMAGFFVPFIYMPTHATDLGLGSWFASSLISIIGITNTGGRIAVGYVSDKPWADCLLINNIALMIGGTATIFVPYLPTRILLSSYAAIFGMSIAVFVSLRSIIMVELMGLEKLTTSFGLVIMCQGMSAFLGAPFAGFLSDTYGNYNAAFCLAGLSLALSGVICIPLRRVARWEARWCRHGATAHMLDVSLAIGSECEHGKDGQGKEEATASKKRFYNQKTISHKVSTASKSTKSFKSTRSTGSPADNADDVIDLDLSAVIGSSVDGSKKRSKFRSS